MTSRAAAARVRDGPATGFTYGVDALDILLEASPDALVVLRPDGWVIRANALAERLFGYSALGLVSVRIDQLFDGGREALATGFDPDPGTRVASQVCRLAGRHADGTTFATETTASRVGDTDGQFFVLAVRSVQDRVLQELAEARLAAVVRSSRDAIIGKGLDGVITSWNPGAERLLGFAAEEMVGTHVRRLVPSRLWHEEEELLRRCAAGGRTDAYQTVRLHRDGHLVDVVGSISPVLDEAGRIFGIASILSNNTGHTLQAEHTHNLNAAILNILEDFSVEKVRLGDTQRAVLNILEDFSVEKVRLGDTQRAMLNIRDDVAAEREKVVEVNSSLRGEVEQRAAAEVELLAKTEQLTTSNSELQQFAYVASHDLQEPLRKVASFCQLLAEQYQGRLDEKAELYLGYVVDGAIRMQQLIDDLLAFARLERKMEVGEAVDCQAALASALDDLAMVILESRAEIVLPTSRPVVTGESSRVKQVFTNLIANALKFKGSADPRIEIRAEQVGEDWHFTFADNGIGIESQYADRIFVVFQRLHARDEYPGTGIGLAICKKIIEQMGGRIWFESEFGSGTTFHLTVPAAEGV